MLKMCIEGDSVENVRRKPDTRNLHDLETDTRNITFGLALTTETGEEDFVVLIHKVQATVVGDCNIAQVNIIDLRERAKPPPILFVLHIPHATP